MNNKLLFENWRKFIKEQEPPNQTAQKKPAGEPIAGDAPGSEQIHVFDFDDTLGVTTNANRVMPYSNGKPSLASEEQAREWMKSKGLSDSDLLEPKFEKVPERGNAISINLTSAGLAKVQKQYDRDKQGVTGVKEPPKEGDAVLIDFTPSSGTDPKTTKPIKSTIDKLKKANSIGAKTAVVTARTATGTVKDIHGKSLNATNAEDMNQFLSSQGAKPTAGVYGVSGQNKGEKIANTFVKGKPNPPKEIHFYDDLSKNTSEVENYLSQDKEVPSEIFIYGPGEFAHNEADPNKPNKKIPAKQPVKESKDKFTMKITKSYLKKVIKEELEHMEEAEVPFSGIGDRPGFASGKKEVAGPEALGDLTGQALHDAISALQFWLKDPEFVKAKGGYYKQRAENLIDQLQGAYEGLERTHIQSLGYTLK